MHPHPPHSRSPTSLCGVVCHDAGKPPNVSGAHCAAQHGYHHREGGAEGGLFSGRLPASPRPPSSKQAAPGSLLDGSKASLYRRALDQERCLFRRHRAREPRLQIASCELAPPGSRSHGRPYINNWVRVRVPGIRQAGQRVIIIILCRCHMCHWHVINN